MIRLNPYTVVAKAGLGLAAVKTEGGFYVEDPESFFSIGEQMAFAAFARRLDASGQCSLIPSKYGAGGGWECPVCRREWMEQYYGKS
jgi:hypothetical protein